MNCKYLILVLLLSSAVLAHRGGKEGHRRRGPHRNGGDNTNMNNMDSNSAPGSSAPGNAGSDSGDMSPYPPTSSYDDCQITVDDYYWDLNPLKRDDGNAYSVKGTDGSIVYFNFCEDLEDLEESKTLGCLGDSYVCQYFPTESGSPLLNNFGTEVNSWGLDTTTYNDTGLYLSYNEGGLCPQTGAPMNTTFHLMCDPSTDFEAMSYNYTDAYGCNMVIMARSSYACPVEVSGGYRRHHGAPIFAFLLPLTVAAVCCCCVALCRRIRRRRCMQKKNCSSTVSTNVAYQPLVEQPAPTPAPAPVAKPVTQVAAPVVPQQPQPAFVSIPMNGQVSYYPYAHQLYPALPTPPTYYPYGPMQMQQPQQPQPAFVPSVATNFSVNAHNSQIELDELYAKRLQDQLNKN